jgi:hypothetical protein
MAAGPRTSQASLETSPRALGIRTMPEPAVQNMQLTGIVSTTALASNLIMLHR